MVSKWREANATWWIYLCIVLPHHLQQIKRKWQSGSINICRESEATKVENLIDINGKNTHHIQDLYADLKKKDEIINKLSVKLNDKREEVYKLKNIIKTQHEKDFAAAIGVEVDN